jgi:hypothetical protein
VSEETPTKLNVEPNFVEPDRYIYANSYRIFGTGQDVTVEFGRTKLQRAGETPTMVGEVGVIMTLAGAERLLLQLAETISRQKTITPVTATFDSRPQEDGDGH